MNTPATPIRTYFRTTHTLLYSYLISLPLLLAYEVLIVISQPDASQAVRISVDVWIKNLFSWLNPHVMSVTLLVVVTAGILIAYRERSRIPHLRLKYFGLMLLESAVYAFTLALLISMVVGTLLQMVQPEAGGFTTLQQLALSLGAGLYEELFFRVILVGGLFWVFQRLVTRRQAAYGLAIVLAALLFSAVHYIGAYGDTFTFGSFLFRFLFGLSLNAIYIWRGFGIAAWTHALYDVMVITFV